MTALYIIFGIIAFIIILLLCSVSLDVKYDDELSVKARYLILCIKLYPANKNSTDKRKKNNNKPGHAKNRQNNKTKHDIFSSFDTTIKVIKLILKQLSDVLSKMRVTRLIVNAKIGDRDAAVCAIKTGAFNAAVYPFISWLSTQIKVNNPKICIQPNYNSKSEYKFLVKFKLRPIHAIKAAIAILFGLIKINIDEDGGHNE